MTKEWLFIGALLYGALYLIAVITTGIIWHNPFAVIVGIMALGVSFLSYALQIIWGRAMICALTVYLGWLLAIAAGASLI